MKRLWVVTAGTVGPWSAIADASVAAWPEVLGPDWTVSVWDWTARQGLLQQAWAQRRAVVSMDFVYQQVGDWLWAALLRERPDVLWVLGGLQVPPEVLTAARDLGVRCIAWALDDPAGLAQAPDRWGAWDAIWTPEPEWYTGGGYVGALAVPPATLALPLLQESIVWDCAVMGGRVAADVGCVWPEEGALLPPRLRWVLWGADAEGLPAALRNSVQTGRLSPWDARRVFAGSAAVINFGEGPVALSGMGWRSRRGIPGSVLDVAAAGVFQICVQLTETPPWDDAVCCRPEQLADTVREWLSPERAADRETRAASGQRWAADATYAARLAAAWKQMG